MTTSPSICDVIMRDLTNEVSKDLRKVVRQLKEVDKQIAVICQVNDRVEEWQVLTRQPLTGRALWLHGTPKVWARPVVWAVRRWLLKADSDKEALGLLGGMVLFVLMGISMLVVFG